MSYYIELSVYKGLVEEKDALSIAHEFCKNQYQNHIHDTVKDHLIYMPCYDTMHENMNIWDLSRATCLYLKNIFTYKFIYWKEYKLLGIVGRYSKTDENFQEIVFQNSTDKNQDYEYWAPLLPLKPIIDKVRNGSIDDIVRQYFIDNRSYIPEEIDEALKKDADYYRKTYVHEQLEEKLRIQNILYDHECEDVTTFLFGYASVNNVAVREETIAVINEWFAELNKYTNEHTPPASEKE